jgi:hypothetical protein
MPGDPWRGATVSADGLSIPSTPSQPIVVADGFHCSDLSTRAASVDQTIAAVQKQALGYMSTWLAQWQSSLPRYRRQPSVDAKPLNA